MAGRTREQLPIQKTGAHAAEAPGGGRRRAWLTDLTPPDDPRGRPKSASARPSAVTRDGDILISKLAQEWYLDLRILGRSEQTIHWYRYNIERYVRAAGDCTLVELSATAVKTHLAELQAQGRAANTVHGRFQVLKSLGCWAEREGYTPDPTLVRLRGPKLPQSELEAYTEAQMGRVLEAASPAWGRLAILAMLGTGMRVSELCALDLGDFEDETEAAFIKVRRGKGAKFRRVPVSQRLRREFQRYLNRHRIETSSERLLVLRDGRPVTPESCRRLFQRIAVKVGFRVHAHKFRHTFATEYLRNGGEIERLRKILGHTTYVMVMRYVHLDKGDLMKDFELRTPY